MRSVFSGIFVVLSTLPLLSCNMSSLNGNQSVGISSESGAKLVSSKPNGAANSGSSSNQGNQANASAAQDNSDLKVYYLVNGQPASSVAVDDSYQMVFEVSAKYWDVVINTPTSGQEIAYSPNYQGQGYADSGSVVKMVVKDQAFTRIDGTVSWIDNADPSKGWKFVTNHLKATADLDAHVMAMAYPAYGAPSAEVKATINISN